METRENLMKMERDDLVDLLLKKLAMVAEMEKRLAEKDEEDGRGDREGPRREG